MMPEQVSGTGHEGNPDGRTQKVVESKSLPAHTQHARQRAGENAQAEDEAGKENAGCAVADEHLLTAFQRGRRNPQDALIAIEQRTPAIVADGVSEIAAERGGAGGRSEEHTSE